MAKFKTLTTSNAGENVELQELSTPFWWERKMYSPFGRQFGRVNEYTLWYIHIIEYYSVIERNEL